jgi:transposase
MLKLDPKWGESADALLRRSVEAPTPHLRERFLALSLIALGQSGIKVAQRLGKSRWTISEWVRRFNASGPEGLVPGWKGHPGRKLTPEELEEVKKVVQKPPRAAGMKTGRWTGRVLRAYLQRHLGKRIHPSTAHRYLHLLGFRKKRPRKKLVKADPQKQQAFAQELEMLERTRSPRSQTVWIDQGQIWADAMLRTMWCLKGQPAEVMSSSPSRTKKLLFYVAVVRPLGKVIPLVVDWFDQYHTAQFLDKLRARLPGWRLDVVWDRASWHRGDAVRKALQSHRLHSHKLPPYSPEMNAAEPWIGWVKETLSVNTCWGDRTALVHAFTGFVASMSKRTEQVLQKCVPEMWGFNCA